MHIKMCFISTKDHIILDHIICKEKIGFGALQFVDICGKPDVHNGINNSLMYIRQLCHKLEHI
jgi:hypothetical protein